jgi:hypothetical protein
VLFPQIPLQPLWRWCKRCARPVLIGTVCAGMTIELCGHHGVDHARPEHPHTHVEANTEPISIAAARPEVMSGGPLYAPGAVYLAHPTPQPRSGALNDGALLSGQMSG